MSLLTSPLAPPHPPTNYSVSSPEAAIFGRQHELTRLKVSCGVAVVTQRDPRYLGVGKSELASGFLAQEDSNTVWSASLDASTPFTLSVGLQRLATQLAERELIDRSAFTPGRLLPLDEIEAAEMISCSPGRWILILDGVPHPDAINECLPTAPAGLTIITSRHGFWQHLGVAPIMVPAFTHDESVEYLTSQHDGASNHNAADAVDYLATATGGNPLALSMLAKARTFFILSYGDLAKRVSNAATTQDPANPNSALASVFAAVSGLLTPEYSGALALLRFLSSGASAAVPTHIVCPEESQETLVPLTELGLITEHHRTTTILPSVRDITTTSWLKPDDPHQTTIIDSLVAGQEPTTVEEVARVRLIVPHLEQQSTPSLEVILPLWRFAVAADDRTTACRLASLVGEHRWRYAPNTELIDLLIATGTLQTKADRAQKSQQIYQCALETSNSWFGPDHESTVAALAATFNHLPQWGQLANAPAMAPLLVDHLRRDMQPAAEQLLGALQNVGSICSRAGQHTAAHDILLPAVAQAEKHLGSDHPITVNIRQTLAQVFAAGDAPEQAIQFQQQVVRSISNLYGSSHEDTLQALAVLAEFHDDNGGLEEALRIYELIFSIRTQMHGPDHPTTQVAQQNRNALATAIAAKETTPTPPASELL